MSVTGTLPYIRGRVFELTAGANANTYATVNGGIILMDSTYYGTFNNKNYAITSIYSTGDAVAAGFIRNAFITTTPAAPNGMLVAYMSPYTTSNPRFVVYGMASSSSPYWGAVTAYTSNAITLKGKYSFGAVPESAFSMEVGNGFYTPYVTAELPLDQVNSIVGTNYTYLVYYIKL